MSDPKRYGFPWLECDATDEAYMQENGMTELKDGGFVLWADYAILQSEVERLTQNTDKLCKHGDLEIERLKAEVESLKEAWVDKKMQQDRDTLLQQVERLRKAGDDLEFLVCFNYEGDIKGDEHCIKILDAWNAAKSDNL